MTLLASRSNPREGWLMPRRLKLKLVTAPATGRVLSAPPVLVATDHSVDFACGHCGAVLLHAEHGQVHGVLIRCKQCGSYNVPDEQQ
jgi:predicted RNA-binding Zn-ribbon protein involved in translation (DUF1610 family)